MSSPTTSFSLPVRAARPKSVTLDPVFSLLYEDNKQALRYFLDYKAPLPMNDIIKAPGFQDFLISREPGPKVEYQNLRPALTVIRSFLLASPNGKKLMSFYKHLLQLQGQWLMAAAEKLGFDIYVQLTHALFTSSDDKKLLDHVTNIVPDAQDKIAQFVMSRTQFDMIIVAERERLHNAHHAAAENLFNLKVSKEFWVQHGKLVSAIEHHEKKLEEIREKAARRKAERDAKAQAAYARNEATLARQMGMAGMTPHLPHVEASVIDYTREMRNNFFSFNDPVTG